MKRCIRKIDKIKASRIALLLIVDIILINLASFLALYVRSDFDYSDMSKAVFFASIKSYWWINTACTVGVFWTLHLYHSLWEYADLKEVISILLGAFLSALLQICGMFFMRLPVPRSFPVFYALFLAVLCGGERLMYRKLRQAYQSRGGNKKNVMIIGAGRAGALVIHDLMSSKSTNYHIACIIDDDRSKWGQFLMGIKIIGGRDEIEKAAKQYNVQEIILAISALSNRSKLEFLQRCQKTNCKMRTMSVSYQNASANAAPIQIRDINIEDLLGRDELSVDLGDISGYIEGKTVLVTGGGGSIGSELCRQVAERAPKQLIIFDIYENNAYEIQQELIRKHPNLNLVVLIGSVRDKERISNVMEKYRPDIVCHAAAHKHVPLMEDSPAEAIKNNVFGTLNTALAASACGVKKFILISTDKAVNPTNIMGASKRICEMIIQMVNEASNTEYAAVRFGNVLGSNGSVVHLFKQQILEGGPVTVTDKNIIRYFMTIPEAVSLVLQAGAYAKGGEIFVLDMGEPVKIDDLARNLIRLYGYEPDVDIDIVYTGLRPGEKLYEELLLKEETDTKTENDLIYIGHEMKVDAAKFEKQLMELRDVEKLSIQEIRELISRIVPTYKMPATPAEDDKPVKSAKRKTPAKAARG